MLAILRRCFSRTISSQGHAVWAEFVTLVHETELFVLAQRCRMMEKQWPDSKRWEVTSGNDGEVPLNKVQVEPNKSGSAVESWKIKYYSRSKLHSLVPMLFLFSGLVGWFMMSQSLVYDWFPVQVEGPTLGWSVVARNRIDMEWYGYWIVDYRKCQPLSCRDSELTHCCTLTAGWGGASKGSCGVFTTHLQKHSETSLCMFPALAVKITLYHSKHMAAGNPHIWWADNLQMEKTHMFQLRMIDSGREMISAWLISDAKRIQSP